MAMPYQILVGSITTSLSSTRTDGGGGIAAAANAGLYAGLLY